MTQKLAIESKSNFLDSGKKGTKHLEGFCNPSGTYEQKDNGGSLNARGVVK